MKAKLLQSVALLGTSLYLEAGSEVVCTRATNQPEGGYFIRPKYGKWPDGFRRNLQDSILIKQSEVKDYLCFSQKKK